MADEIDAGQARGEVARPKDSLRRGSVARSPGNGETVFFKQLGITSQRVSSQVHLDGHALWLLDQAGWHTTDKLKVPDNTTLVPLPPRAPELNPVENIW